MNKMKRILALLCVLVMLSAIFAGCNGPDKEDPTDPTGSGVVIGQTTNYTVKVTSMGGLPLSGVTLLVYADEALTDLTAYGQTDAAGQAVISLEGASAYYLTLTNLPAGYIADASYLMNSASMQITLTSQVIADSNLSGVKYELGSVMHDFTVTAANGTTYTLSTLLEQKDAVILNFWYTTCAYCVEEFPYLDAVYQQYSDSVEVLALNNYSADTPSDVEDFQNYFYTMYPTTVKTEGGLAFPMVYDDLGITGTFSLSGYPTSVVIDRYGVVCMVYSGGLPSEEYWGYIFDAFVGEDYTQKLYTGFDELMPVFTPTCEMPSSEEIDAVFSSGELNVHYSGEEGTDDAAMSWPFIIGEKDGVSCIYPSNSNVINSYATMYANITLEAGDVVAFDYYSSSEQYADVLYVLVDREDIYQISGEGTGWKTCYTWVAEEAGEYEIAFCYLKDASDSVGDDTVYLANLRVCGVGDIDQATYIPRQCATNLRADGFGYENYATVVYNEKDGYYHVGTANGPLLLANMMMPSQFSNSEVYTLVYNHAAENNGEFKINGVDYYDEIINFCSYASNSQIYSMVGVNQELKELLVMVADMFGVEQTENEWLQMCSYYDAYGTGGVQMGDPAIGLAAHSAYPAALGKNTVTYDRIIMPRGLLYEFIPTTSGVYRITSSSETYVDGWIFTEESLKNREAVYTYWFKERAWTDPMNVSMVVYLEAGKPYYIDVAFSEVTSLGSIDFTISYEAKRCDLLVLASPGYSTYYEGSYQIIADGIDIVLGTDGYYHEKRANGTQGSKLYLDMTAYSNIFTTKSLIDLIEGGAFDFSKTEDDQWVLDYYDYFEAIAKQNGEEFDIVAFEECMMEVWGEDFEAKWAMFEVEDVLDGYYHGNGEDYTELMRKYAKNIYTSGELAGCVAVDKQLGDVLQLLMDKYYFEGVENSWIKLCYYYEYIGA